ncbi:MAG: hypothetical protein AAGF12_30015, partial [Myxococcota bacterium]
ARAEVALAHLAYDRAVRLCREVIALEGDGQGHVIPRLRAQRTLGETLDSLGEHRTAVYELDRAIADAERLDIPALAGLLHITRAKLALRHEDRVEYDHHYSRAAEWLRPTENPVLVGALERLSAAADPSRPGSQRPGPLSDPGSSETTYEVTIAARRKKN